MKGWKVNRIEIQGGAGGKVISGHDGSHYADYASDGVYVTLYAIYEKPLLIKVHSDLEKAVNLDPFLDNLHWKWLLSVTHII